VLCVDVEPERVHDGMNPKRPVGFETVVELMPRLRELLSNLAGTPAHFVWCLRMDPNIAEVYGQPEWFATTYRTELERFVDAGDELGLHPHCWRWSEGWVADHEDPGWIAHCAEIGLAAYERAFGERCRVYRHGDGYMSDALLAQIEQAGVQIDLTVEPGRRAMRSLDERELAKGWLPDTLTAPRHAYRPMRQDFRAPDPIRSDGVLILPLTPGEVDAIGVSGQRLSASYPTLVPWSEPTGFVTRLRQRLEADDVSHLAFAIHSQVTLSSDYWEATVRNLTAVARELGDRHRWCTATEAATLADASAQPV
jgi:hypothetical protein